MKPYLFIDSDEQGASFVVAYGAENYGIRYNSNGQVCHCLQMYADGTNAVKPPRDKDLIRRLGEIARPGYDDWKAGNTKKESAMAWFMMRQAVLAVDDRPAVAHELRQETTDMLEDVGQKEPILYLIGCAVISFIVVFSLLT